MAWLGRSAGTSLRKSSLRYNMNKELRGTQAFTRGKANVPDRKNQRVPSRGVAGPWWLNVID